MQVRWLLTGFKIHDNLLKLPGKANPAYPICRMGALTLVTPESKLSSMRVKIVDDVPQGRLFGEAGPDGGTYGECFYLTIKDDAVFARCMFEGWSGMWELELSWLLHESEDGPTTYV